MVCAKEYAYREDTNYPIRNKMEDGIINYYFFTAHYYLDNCLNDGSSGLFAVFDGHGGEDVVEFITKVLPEVTNILIQKTFIKEFKNFNSNNPNVYFE